ncbi:helix-turn-helix domain-containing protein [Kordiimonas pumila]|uniref:Helix-turn-helix domain-containing protein n=1 Tax=Kordiimonas pumila TaxID=2161677 RepID=A0ABV7D514_9PROT|nr:helix-turn-helix domain-containing protein [Kordiimonas pumila]
MTSSQTSRYPGWSAAAWLPMHKMLVQDERSWSVIRPHQVHNISAFHPEERLRAWQDALRLTFTDLIPETTYKNDFGGMIETVDCAGLKISRITAEAQKVHRSFREIEKSKSNTVYLNVHLGGTARVLHSNGTTNLRLGDCILVDPRQPYVLEFESPFRQLCIQLPEWSLREQLDAPLETALGQSFSMTSRTGKVLLAALELMLLEADSGTVLESSAELFMQVMNHSLNEAIRGPLNGDSQTTAKTGLATRLRQYIGQNFRDENITPNEAAAALNCSLRNIHKTCQTMGTTFGKLILDARLSAAAQALAYTKYPQARISDVAFDSGFSDISHFCKVFRVRFGVSPTEFRKQRS